MRIDRVIQLCVIAAILCAMAPLADCDRSFQTQGFFQCSEKEPPFDSNTCNQFTQYAAFVDLVGGGSSVKVLKLVGNSAMPLINLEQYDNGTVSCPPGFGCTFLENSQTTVSVVRSPLPAGIPTVLPGDDVSIGFYWKLTRNNNLSPDNRLPYAYQVANCSGSRPFSTCEDYPNSVRYVEYNPFEVDESIDINEPGCGAQCFGDVDLRGTCGPMVPDPNGWLSDSDGKCSEICCDTSNSIKVRQLGPYCYSFSAQGPPKIAVDFAVTVQNDAIGPDPIIVPVYGMTDPQSLFVNETGVRVRILSLIDDLERFDNANAFSVVHGSIVMCVNETTAGVGSVPGRPIFPNEVDGPVANVTDMQWFFVPSTYLPFYRDATAAEAAQIIKPNSPPDTTHQKVYGEAGSVVEQAIVEYLNENFDAVTATDMCNDLSGVLPFVPGYDTDEPLTQLSPYELPSNCWMWNAAREGNIGFLPPSFNMSSPNWYIRKGIPSAQQASATYDPNDLYLIYLPTLEQIEEANARESFKNAMLLSVEINDQVMAYTDTVQVPGSVSASPPATCTMPSIETVVDGNTGEGKFWFSIESTLSAPLASGAVVDPIEVEVACQMVPGAPGFLRLSPSGPVEYTLNYQDKIRLAYNVSITYQYKYENSTTDGSVVANCFVTLRDVNKLDNEQIVGPVPCQVLKYDTPNSNDDDDCSFCDIDCMKAQKISYAKMGCFWIFIVVGVIILALIAVAIWAAVHYNQGKLQHQHDTQTLSHRKVLSEELKLKKVESARLAKLKRITAARSGAASSSSSAAVTSVVPS